MKNPLLLATFFLLIACNPSAKKEGNRDLQGLKDEVMAIHDEVMPKMGELRKARKELMFLADSIVTIDSSKAQKMINAANELDRANEGMMVWMRQYEPQFEASEDSLWNYYANQKELIQKVSEEMFLELKKGQDLLN